MDVLVFRSAIPFAYLAFAALLFLMLIAGGAVGLLGWRKRRRIQAAAGALIVTFVAVVALVNIAFDKALEPNPVFSASDVVGVWRDGAATLTLRSDGGYSCVGGGECDVLHPNGNWERKGDFEILFDRDTGRRVVSYRGKFRLAAMFEDLDSWDGRLTFRHAPPAS